MNGHATPYAAGDARPPRRGLWARIAASRVIVLSIVLHLLFGLGATYWIVQSIQAKRKLAFQGGPTSPNPSTRALEHQINMSRRQQTMSAPAQARRITTTGLSKISLPDIPTLTAADDITPDKMAGMGGVGVGFGMPGGGGGGGGGGGRGVTLFGFQSGGAGLRGTFYDLKQTQNRESTEVHDIRSYAVQVSHFVDSGWDLNVLARFYRSPHSLYATQFFVPVIDSKEAPKAFGVEKEVKPSLWMALYEGDISPPESGTYHFVAGADNVLIVKLNGQVVLNDSWDYNILTDWRPQISYEYKFLPPKVILIPKGFSEGNAMQLDARQFYHIQVLIGDDGGHCHFSLMVKKEGVDYPRTNYGVTYFPVLRFANDKPPEGIHPPFVPDGPIWKSRPSQTSILGSMH